MTQRKRIMRDFVIKELSVVDRPAQAHARMTLMKREDSDKENRMELYNITGFPTFEAAVSAIAEHEGCPAHIAMSHAAAAYPDLMEMYQREGDDRVAKAAEDVVSKQKNPAAVERFELMVDGIAEREKCSRSVAMSRARKENPEAFAAYQAA